MTAALEASQAAARAALRQHGIAGEYVLFAAARVDPTKGCHTLLEAYRGLDGAPPLVVVGDLHHKPGYEDQQRELAKGLNVTFVPRIDEKPTVMGLVAEATAFVFPSTVEAMSIMLLEALAVGVPTVASDIPENLAVLPPEVPTFRAGDADSLRMALRDLLGMPEDARRERAERTRQAVLARHDWDAIVAEYERLYRFALERYHPRRRGLLRRR